jgi:SAM-dependent methyltransferase
MTITPIKHQISAALQLEIDSLKKHREDPNDLMHRDIFEILQQYPETLSGMEIVQRIKQYPSKLKILDIGCGPGLSSLYLASLGHQVFAVEPSPFECEILLANARKTKLPVKIFQCTAEAIDAIPEQDFDLCLFNSSLHHCDDPHRALSNAFSLLKKGARLLVLNEPILRFYRSKKWFYRALIRTPEKMGHYGGNEHTYYYREYRKMLQQAGFTKVEDFLNSRISDPRSYIHGLLLKKLSGVYINGDLVLLCKFAWLLFLNKIQKLGLPARIFFRCLKNLSLLQVSFEAKKD